MHAQILTLKLGYLEGWIERRRELAEVYGLRLAGSGIDLPKQADGNRHVYYLYVVRHPERDRILEEPRNRDIHCTISYRFPIHTMRGYQCFNYKEGDLPATEAAAREIFSLPLFPTLRDDEQETICRALEDILS